MKVGAVAEADSIFVTTFTAVPAVGSVPLLKEPADQSILRVFPVTVNSRVGKVQEGRVPALPKGFTAAVLAATETSGADTVPAGL